MSQDPRQRFTFKEHTLHWEWFSFLYWIIPLITVIKSKKQENNIISWLKCNFRPICLPDPVKDLKHESGPFTAAGFGYTNDFFSNYEELTGLKVPYVELLREEDVKDLYKAEKVILKWTRACYYNVKLLHSVLFRILEDF